VLASFRKDVREQVGKFTVNLVNNKKLSVIRMPISQSRWKQYLKGGSWITLYRGVYEVQTEVYDGELEVKFEFECGTDIIVTIFPGPITKCDGCPSGYTPDGDLCILEIETQSGQDQTHSIELSNNSKLRMKAEFQKKKKVKSGSFTTLIEGVSDIRVIDQKVSSDQVWSQYLNNGDYVRLKKGIHHFRFKARDGDLTNHIEMVCTAIVIPPTPAPTPRPTPRPTPAPPCKCESPYGMKHGICQNTIDTGNGEKETKELVFSTPTNLRIKVKFMKEANDKNGLFTAKLHGFKRYVIHNKKVSNSKWEGYLNGGKWITLQGSNTFFQEADNGEVWTTFEIDCKL
jgi:hypothetical protein